MNVSTVLAWIWPTGGCVPVKSSKRKQGELGIAGASASFWAGHLALRSIPRNRTRTPTAGYVDAAWSSRFRDLRLRYLRYQSLPWVDQRFYTALPATTLLFAPEICCCRRWALSRSGPLRQMLIYFLARVVVVLRREMKGKRKRRFVLSDRCRECDQVRKLDSSSDAYLGRSLIHGTARREK